MRQKRAYDPLSAIQIPEYKPAGPTLEAFHRSNARVRGIMGPKGGGKTVACAQECKIRSVMQQPVMVDGFPVRLAKGAVFQKTYRQIRRNLLPSWFSVMPKDGPGCSFRGGENEPGIHRFTLLGADGVYTDVEVEFLAIDAANAEEVLQGKQLTWAWGNEAAQLCEDWFLNIGGRVGRFPSGELGKPVWYGWWMDFNAPDEDNILYDWMTAPIDTAKRVREVYGDMSDEAVKLILDGGMQFFVQPGGLDPQAENLANLPGGVAYYYQMLLKKPDWWIRRMIHNKFGFSRDGEPVFPEYSDTRHIAPSQFDYRDDRPLYCGLDAGRTPAAVFVQINPGGHFVVIAEYCFTGSVRLFARGLREFMMQQFGTIECEFVADPSAASARSDTDDDTWTDIFGDEFGCDPPQAADSNALTPRLSVISSLLTEPDIDGLPRFLLHPRCVMLRRGFNSGYRWRKLPNTGYIDRSHPDKKHPSSHPMDALQYIAMRVTGFDQVVHRRQQAFEERQPRSRMQKLLADEPAFDPTAM